MGEKLIKQAEPSSPASDYVDIFADQNDANRLKVKTYEGVVYSLGMISRDNIIRNSGFWFRQRASDGGTLSNTSGRTGSADGWGITNENASITYTRGNAVTTPESGLTAPYYGTWAKTTSTGKMVISQVIEGIHLSPIRSKTVRLQVKLKASASKTIRLAILQLTSAGTLDTMPATFISAFNANNTDPTVGTNLSYIAPKSGVTPDNCTVSGNGLTCSVTTAWQRFGGVFDIPSDCKNIVIMVFTDSQFAASDSFSMSEVSLTEGYEIQNWSPDNMDVERQRCERYYFKTFFIDNIPAQNAGANSGEFRWSNMVGASTAFAGVGFRWPVRMRTSPTVTLYNPAATNAQIRNFTDSTDCTVSTANNALENGVHLSGTTAAGAAAGEQMGVHMSADAAGTNGEFV